jgi:hypothetical protein
MARQIATFLGNSELEPPDRKFEQPARLFRQARIKFFDDFAETMQRLEAIANKELQARALDREEKKFLKAVIVENFIGGCRPRTYFTGWYPKLFYGGNAEYREPTVADVHTDVESGMFLEEGVGDARYLVIAIDNQRDHAVYVGPAYSYYEFSSATRLTDAEWDQRRANTPSPSFTAGFATPAVHRSMSYPPKPEPPAEPPGPTLNDELQLIFK